MTHTQLTDKINQLGYKGLKEAYERQSEDINYATMSFEERLWGLLDAQDIFLKNKRITMNHRLSKIKEREACPWGINKLHLMLLIIKLTEELIKPRYYHYHN